MEFCARLIISDLYMVCNLFLASAILFEANHQYVSPTQDWPQNDIRFLISVSLLLHLAVFLLDSGCLLSNVIPALWLPRPVSTNSHTMAMELRKASRCGEAPKISCRYGPQIGIGRVLPMALRLRRQRLCK